MLYVQVGSERFRRHPAVSETRAGLCIYVWSEKAVREIGLDRITCKSSRWFPNIFFDVQP